MTPREIALLLRTRVPYQRLRTRENRLCNTTTCRNWILKGHLGWRCKQPGDYARWYCDECKFKWEPRELARGGHHVQWPVCLSFPWSAGYDQEKPVLPRPVERAVLLREFGWQVVVLEWYATVEAAWQQRRTR